MVLRVVWPCWRAIPLTEELAKLPCKQETVNISMVVPLMFVPATRRDRWPAAATFALQLVTLLPPLSPTGATEATPWSQGAPLPAETHPIAVELWPCAAAELWQAPVALRVSCLAAAPMGNLGHCCSQAAMEAWHLDPSP
jgi:hypothetical protein